MESIHAGENKSKKDLESKSEPVNFKSDIEPHKPSDGENGKNLKKSTAEFNEVIDIKSESDEDEVSIDSSEDLSSNDNDTVSSWEYFNPTIGFW